MTWLTMTFVPESEDGDFVERTVEVPAYWEICGRCRGDGAHVHPGIDGNGITASEWAEWAPEEQEDYMTGAYDVACSQCGGTGKILHPDRDRCSPEIRALLDERERQEQERARDYASEAWLRRQESGDW